MPSSERDCNSCKFLLNASDLLESCSSYSQQIENLCFRGVSCEDLCLDFTLPGYPQFVLKVKKVSDGAD